jgi:hypothetical protein
MQHRVSSAFLALVSSACSAFAPRAMPVSELRHFPEYGGYLPVALDGRVHAEWVAPNGLDGGGETYDAPHTPEEAHERLAQSRARETRRPLQAVGTVLASPLGLAWPAFEVAAALQQDHDAPQDGPYTQIELDVRDERGVELREVYVRELSTWVEAPSWLDGDRRRLGAPRRTHVTPPRPWAEAFARNFRVVFELELRAPHGIRRVHAPVLAAVLEEPFIAAENVYPAQVSSSAPEHRHVSFMASELSERDGDGWRWRADAPRPLLRLIVWAPGHEPALVELDPERPSDPIRATVRLRSRPDRAKIESAHRRWIETAVGVTREIRSNRWTGRIEVDAPRLRERREILEQICADPDLPAWLRWNCSVTLRRFAGLEVALLERIDSERFTRLDAPLHDELDRARAAVHAPLAGTPFVSGRPDGPVELLVRLHSWRQRANELGLDRDETDDEGRRAEQTRLAAQARELLTLGEALWPAQPELDVLRAALALHEGDPARARAHSAPLDTASYFGLFYGSLRAQKREQVR